MSLSAFALRLATVYALRGKTLAGNAVKDSPANPLPDPLPGVQICVFSGKHSLAPDAGELIGGDQMVDLTIHFHIPASVAVTDGIRTLDIEASAGGTGVVFDLLWRQVVRALMADPGPWADLWRTIFVKAHGEVESEPFLIEAEKGVRIHAREIRMTAETLCDPPFGAPPAGSPWATLLTLMRAEPALAALADVVEFEITTPLGQPRWEQQRTALGLTNAELAASGLAPVATNMTEAASLFTATGDDGDTFTVDTATPNPGNLP